MPAPAKSKTAKPAKVSPEKSTATSPTARPVKKGDHVFLVDGSGYIFRAYHAIRFEPRTPDGTHVNAVYGFCNMLWKLLKEMKPDERPTHLAVVFDKSEKTFRTEMYKEYKAHRPPPPDDLIPQFPLIRDAVRAFEIPCLEQAGYEADDLIATYARMACEAGATVNNRIVRQGSHAARERLRAHVRHHEGCAHRNSRGHREIRRAAGQGHRGPGADRRHIRQRARRPGHRRENRGAADRRIWRSRNAAQACWRDQAGQTPSGPHRQCRGCAHVQEACHAGRPRAAGCADRKPRRARAGLQSADRISQVDGLQDADPARRREKRGRRGAGRGQRRGFDALQQSQALPLFLRAGLPDRDSCRSMSPRRAKPRDRAHLRSRRFRWRSVVWPHCGR